MTRDDNVDVVMKVVRNGINMPGYVTIASFSSKPDETQDASDKAVDWIWTTFNYYGNKAAIRIVNTDTGKIVGSSNWHYNEETGEEE